MSEGHGLAPGATFAGRYVIERLLKRGGMGAVYAARHVRTHAEVALKVMRPEVVGDPTMRERFTREAQVASIIKSAHVVTVFDADVDPATGMPFLVMELLHGSDLGELSLRSALVASDVIAWLGQAARALDRAHALGIVHRDLKPENLFLAHSDDEPARIKVLDFGIAKLLQVATAHGGSREIGTPLYMAPEQMNARAEVGAWTDVWALGLTAYTLLVGRPYWLGETVHEIYGEILREDREPASLRAQRAGATLPPAFDAWFARCTANEGRARYASAGEAVARLAETFGESWGATPVPPTVQHAPIATAPMHTEPMRTEPMRTGTPLLVSPSPPSSSSRLPFVVAGALVGVVAWAAVWLSTRPREVPPPLAPSVSPSVTPSSPPKPEVSLARVIEATNPFVAIGSIALQRHEVTRGELAMYLLKVPPLERPRARPLADWPEDGPVLGRQRPVTWISEPRAARFCAAIDARLPTVQELRAALEGKKYPWGNAFPPPAKVAFDRAAQKDLPDVESFPADVTSAGVHDLFGSVSEWTSNVDAGFAAVWGVSLGTPARDAASNFASPAQKEVEDSDSDQPNEIAAAQLGFRCAR